MADPEPTYEQLDLIQRQMLALRGVQFPPGARHKEFVHQVCSTRRADSLTPRQRDMVAILAWRYRRQLPADLVPATQPALMPPAPKRRTVAAAIGAFLLLALPAAAQAPPPRLSTVPALAVDGDTLRVDGQLVRLVGLDAPELHARCAVELELAQAARDRLRELVAGGVNLEYLNARDRYGRLLAIARQPNGYNVADVLIGEGLARRYDGRTARAGWCP